MLSSRHGASCSYQFYRESEHAALSGKSIAVLVPRRGFSAIGEEKPAYEVSGGLLVVFASCDVVN